MKTTILSIRKFPADLHKTLHMQALTRGKSLRDLVIEMLTDASLTEVVSMAKAYGLKRKVKAT